MRASRRGLVDLIVMIVMIVFLLGMATLAFLTIDRAQKERTYLGALRDIPVRQKAEMDTVKARYAQLSSHIGFKGNAAYSSPKQVEAMIEEGSRLVQDYYDVSLTPAGLSGTAEADTAVLQLDPNGNWVIAPSRVRVVRNTKVGNTLLYQPGETRSLQVALGAQDKLINELVSTHIPNVSTQRATEGTLRDKAASDRETASTQVYNETISDIGGAHEALRNKNAELADEDANIAAALENELRAAQELNSPAAREAREAAFAKAREAAKALAEAARVQEAQRLQSDKRRYDDSRDPDGRVFLADEDSGSVWIDIGQRTGLHVGQTFQVVRPDASRSSEVQIGEIRVKQLLEGNVARCHVDSLDDPSMFPRAGDLIKNPNFSARQYQKWALVGTFGGTFTKHTRQQLIDILRRTGFQVVETIDETVDAVIIGGNWMSDPEWMKAKELMLNIETYPEEEVLHFLGMSGPDRK